MRPRSTGLVIAGVGALLVAIAVAGTGLGAGTPTRTAGKAAGAVAAPLPPDPAGRGDVPLPARIEIDAARPRHPVALDLLGVNHHYNDDGFGLWDPVADRPEPLAVQGARRAGVQSMRFPGGTIANTYDWKRAIGETRGCQVDGQGSTATGFPAVTAGLSYGPDEHMQFLAAIDAEPLIMVPFVTETPADAASWVEYLNSPAGTAANPGGGIDWAEVRAANGHPEPYGVRRWEIGNEQHHRASRYWMSADDQTALDQYAFGGERAVVDEALGGRCSHPLGGVPGDGTPGQVRSVVFPPVAPASVRLTVAGRRWHPVDDITDARPGERGYELRAETGRVRFGSGRRGAVLPRGAVVRASYRSVHEGYFAFARAMHAVDPDIDVCASWGRLAFVERVADRPYDCLTAHPLTSLRRQGDGRWVDPLEGHDWHVLTAEDRAAGIAVLRDAMPAGTPLLLTEFSFLEGDSAAFPSWPAAQSGAVAMASLWAAWMRQGLSWGMGSALLWDFDRVLLGPAPDFTTTAQAVTRRTLLPMLASGGQVVRTEVPVNPVRDPHLAAGTYRALSVVSVRSADTVWVLVVNRLPFATVAADVELRGAVASGPAAVRTATGPSFRSWNRPDRPPAVRMTIGERRVGPGGFRHVFGPHSVTVLRVPTR